ncbi:hypothetical protein Q8A73_021227 [Channa argus]|nr:hypothetical protein Q8A73_021227 [Channa argus]
MFCVLRRLHARGDRAEELRGMREKFSLPPQSPGPSPPALLLSSLSTSAAAADPQSPGSRSHPQLQLIHISPQKCASNRRVNQLQALGARPVSDTGQHELCCKVVELLVLC